MVASACVEPRLEELEGRLTAIVAASGGKLASVVREVQALLIGA